MIYRFWHRNFYSFKGETEVSLVVKPQAGQRHIFHEDGCGGRVNAVIGVFGANASGKSNLLKALAFMRWFITRSAQQEPDKKLPEMFFRFCPEPDKDVQLGMEFSVDGIVFKYEVVLNPDRVIRETLYQRKARYAYVFQREWNPSSASYSFKAQDFGDTTKLPIRENASVVASALLQDNQLARKLDAYFSNYYGNLSHTGRTRRHDPILNNLLETAEFFSEHKEHLSWVNQRLAHFDLGLSDIEITKTGLLLPDGREREVDAPYGIHSIDGHTYKLPLIEESRGTQALFILLRYILPVLQDGGVATIDEFEVGLHSHMVPRLVELFYSEKHNPKKAQLIFSCHSDYVLNFLEKYQVILTGKGEDCVTQAWRLDSVAGVRNVDNLFSKYHAGAYGGVPNF